MIAGHKSFGIDSEIGVLSYLSYVQERHMKIVLKEMLTVSEIGKFYFRSFECKKEKKYLFIFHADKSL